MVVMVACLLVSVVTGLTCGAITVCVCVCVCEDLCRCRYTNYLDLWQRGGHTFGCAIVLCPTAQWQ